MFVNQQHISDRIGSLAALQHDPALRPARLTKKGEELRAQKKEEKRVARNEYERKRRDESAKLNERKETVKKVKAIVQARKVQRNLVDAPLKVNEGHIKLTRATDEKKFAPRIGPPDLSGQTRVQVDSKTWIYVREGRDIQTVIDKYKNRHNNF
jgi:hypothetical protein